MARALLAEPDWLFLDEATASLDEKSEADLYRAIAETLPETTIVSIGHTSTLNAFHKRRITFETHEGAPATVVTAPRLLSDRRLSLKRAGEPHRAARSLDHEIAVDQVPFRAAQKPGQEAELQRLEVLVGALLLGQRIGTDGEMLILDRIHVADHELQPV